MENLIENFYKNNHRKLVKRFKKIMKSQEDAEDIVHEYFTKLLNKKRLDPRDTDIKYAIGYIKNMIKDEVRKKERLGITIEPIEDDIICEENEEKTYDLKMLTIINKQIVPKLRLKKQQRLVWKHWYNKMPMEEIMMRLALTSRELTIIKNRLVFKIRNYIMCHKSLFPDLYYKAKVTTPWWKEDVFKPEIKKPKPPIKNKSQMVEETKKYRKYLKAIRLLNAEN